MRTLLPLLLLGCLCAAAIPAHAGAWVTPRGELMVKIAGLGEWADDFYALRSATLADGTEVSPGDRRPYDDGGATRQLILWMEAEYGISDRLSLGLQGVWKGLRFEDDFSLTETWGWGDAWAVARYGLLTGSDRLTVRSAFKVPVGRFSTDLGRIPIGENQADLDLGLQWGRSLGRALSWVGAESARRFRFEDKSRNFDPGDEWYVRAEAGWGFDRKGRFGVKVGWVTQRGDDTSLNFFAPGTELARDFDQIEIGGLIDLGFVFVEPGWSRILGSDSFPAAGMWSLGLTRRFRPAG